MEFQRNEYFDNLIIEVKDNKSILKRLDYEELSMLINYMFELKRYLQKGLQDS